MSIVLKIVQFLLSLSLLVILHELGHFIPAKLFKTRVEKFYLFFNPWVSLFKFKKADTEYGIGWLPLGGYVKIAGMVDESMDTQQLAKPAEPWEFRAKPVWQRLIIMAGGVTVNLLLGFFIYAMMLYAWGEVKIDNQNTPYGYDFSAFMKKELQLKTADHLIAIDGEPVAFFNQIPERLLLAKQITVMREGTPINMDVPKNFVELLQQEGNKIEPMVQLRFPLVVGQILPESPNIDTGLQADDEVLAVNGQAVPFFDVFKTIIGNYASQVVTLSIRRNQENIELQVAVSPEGKIGIVPKMLTFNELQERGIYQAKNLTYSFWASLPAGVRKGMDTLTNYVKQLGLFFQPETKAYKSIGGFASIGSMFPSAWDAATFWNITAVLSIILAFMNFLPIPALDGGHVVFTLYEMITGHKPSDKFLEYAQITGFIILMGLLLLANGNDIYKWLTGKF